MLRTRSFPGRLLLVLSLFAAWLSLAYAQEEAEEASPAADSEATADTEAAPSEEDSSADDLLDDPLLDAQGFDPNDDDDFIPSEDIPADAPIAFPTDI
ncbi:MAG: hypothetical protein AAFX56_11475 [Pseudomonadota bacterium]